MTDNDTVQMNDDTTGQDAPQQPQDENVDYKSLYLDEVQNAKKLRKRAQDAEASLQESTKAQKTAKVKQLKEQENFKELSETLQAQLNEIAPYKEKWETHDAKRREDALSKLPEADREALSSKDTDTLEYIVSIREQSKPINPSHTPAQSRNIKSSVEGQDWTKMDDRDRRNNWDDIVDSYKNKIK